MTERSQPVPVQVEYNPKKRRISFDRIFQIPQMFRPAASVFFANTLGLVNLDRPSTGLTAIADWFRFSRWRRMHPASRARPTENAATVPGSMKMLSPQRI